MKSARLPLSILGVILALGVAGLAVALTPAVQRWAVRRAVAGQPGLKLELAAVSAGFSSITLQGVTVEKGGLRVSLDRLESDWSPLSLLFSRRLVIHRLKAGGLVVDASRISPQRAQLAAAGAPGAAAATPG